MIFIYHFHHPGNVCIMQRLSTLVKRKNDSFCALSHYQVFKCGTLTPVIKQPYVRLGIEYESSWLRYPACKCHAPRYTGHPYP